MKRVSTVSLMACLLLWMIPASAQNVQRGAFVVHEYHHDVSPPARDLVSNDVFLGNRGALLSPIRVLGAAGNTSRDPVAQTEILPEVGTTNLVNIDGIGHTGFAPPDTNASVGGTQVVETVNLNYAVYDKTTGAIIKAPTAISSLFSGFGGTCQTGSTSDPVVLWDKAASRWVISILAYTGNFTSTECYAVSTSTDATGTYNRYGFTFANGLLADFPKSAVWSDAYYLTFNGFQNAATFIGAEPCALDRTKMLAGAAATAVCFPPKSTNYGMLPSDIDGLTPPPAGAPNHMMELDAVSFTKLDQFDFHVDFVTPSNSTFTGPIAVTIPTWTQICVTQGRACIPEPSPGEPLDGRADKLVFRLAYRNYGDHEAMVVNHAVKPSSGAAVAATRWYEFRSTPPGGSFSVFQSGTFQHPKYSLWNGSIAMDKVGNMALGLSASASTLNPSVVYTGRKPTDAAGKMETPFVVVKGTGVQTATSNRWGDYASMSIDPSDDCTFWFAQEYIKTTGSFNWNTRLNSFKFTTCQ
jgi:hypothetical protein